MELFWQDSTSGVIITQNNVVLAIDRPGKRIYLRDTIDVSVILSNNHRLTLTPPNNKRVLNFHKDNLITGINVIDDLLFWTDNSSEPKKIDINRSRSGTIDIYTHTRVYNPNRDFTALGNQPVISITGGLVAAAQYSGIPIKEHHVTVIKKSPISAPNLKMFGVGARNISCFAYGSTNNANSTNFEEGSTNTPLDPFTTHKISVYNTSDTHA